MGDGSKLYLCLGDEYKSKALMEQCISNDEIATCENQINEKVASSYDGEYVAKPLGPGSCSSPNWMCKGKNYKTDKTTYEKECIPVVPEKPKDCGEPPKFWCEWESRRTRDICIEWNKCKGNL